MTGNLLCSPDTLFRHIGLLNGERLDYVIGFENNRIHPSTRHRIRCGFIFFHSGERIYFFSGFAVEFTGCAWTVAVSGEKKLRIRKYPDTSGRGLKIGATKSRLNSSMVANLRGSYLTSCTSLKHGNEHAVSSCYSLDSRLLSARTC